MRNKKGSYTVEATIVFPILILSIVTVVGIIVFMYKNVEANVATHISIIQELGLETETNAYFGKIPDGVNLETDKQLIFYKVYGENYVLSKDFGLIGGELDNTIENIGSAANEKEYIRISDFIKGN